jgi:hypothetical protein
MLAVGTNMFVIAGQAKRDPSTQCAHVCARGRRTLSVCNGTAFKESLRLADARRLGGGVKPGHDELGFVRVLCGQLPGHRPA